MCQFHFFVLGINGHPCWERRRRFVDAEVQEADRTGIGFWITTIFAEIVLGILASMIVMKFSRYREFRADAAGAHLADRSGMIGALNRLLAEQNAEVPSSMPDSMYAFGISSGFKHNFIKLFASHPPLEDRIRALQQNMS